jgi:hypothetical protein
MLVLLGVAMQQNFYGHPKFETGYTYAVKPNVQVNRTRPSRNPTEATKLQTRAKPEKRTKGRVPVERTVRLDFSANVLNLPWLLSSFAG